MSEAIRNKSSKAKTKRINIPSSSPRNLLFLFSALIFATSTLLAFTQDSFTNLSKSKSFLSKNWWLYPVESNAHLRLPYINSSINDLFVLPDGKNLWIVGDGGLILHSSNAGVSWQQQGIVPVKPVIQSQQKQVNKQSSWHFFKQAYADTSQTKTPQRKTSQTESISQTSLYPPEKVNTEKVNTEKSDVRKADTKKEISSQKNKKATRLKLIEKKKSLNTSNTLNPTVNLTSVFFLNSKTGWAAGNNGTIIHTRDGGNSWHKQNSGISEKLNSVVFLSDGLRGWAVGRKGTIINTSNGGDSWQKQNSDTLMTLNKVQFLNDGLKGWVVVNGLSVLRTVNGGKTWAIKNNTFADISSGLLNDIFFLKDGLRGWAVGEYKSPTIISAGLIIQTTDGGISWQPKATQPNALYAIHFLEDAQQAWAAGRYSSIYHTFDAGNTWTNQYGIDYFVRYNKLETYNDGALYNIQFLKDGLHGWAVGNKGAIVSTLNGGQSWWQLSTNKQQNSSDIYQRYPAPWYYLSWLVIAGLLAPTLRREKTEFDENESIADLLVSDRPLEKGDPDPLGFNAIAQGLSRFIRNENTRPPLTLAITGAWGSGKSSLMNLLKADLKSFGFQPVWFNAWHYQKEEHLLAALLSNIRDQAIPPWWCYAGIVFRARLMLMRGWRQCFPLLILLAVFVASSSFLYQQPENIEQRLSSLTKTVQSFFQSSKDIQKDIENSNLNINKKWSEKNEQNMMVDSSFIISLMALISIFIKGFTAFGINPTRLMSSMSKRSNAKDLSKQLSFRHQFSREFKDVTRALGERTMVIMVDDLDRCRPESVLEVLESINFLVSSGDCYIVLGMDPKRVVSCVALGFKDLSAQDHLDDNTDKEQNSSETYATSYLEKLINIEIPMPVPETSQSEKLLTGESKEFEKLTFMQRAFHFAWKNRQRLFVITVVLLVITASWQLGFKLGEAPEPAKQATNSIEKNTTFETQQTSNALAANKAIQESAENKQPARFKAGQISDVSSYFTLPPILLILSTGAWIFWLRQPKVVIKDSPEFIRALSIWHKLVICKKQTPRSIKRFMNRVRFFAMHQQPQQKQNKSILDWFKKSKTKSKIPDHIQYIPEQTLVALTAIHHTNPEWLDDDALFKSRSINHIALPHKSKDDENTASRGEFIDSVTMHIEQFGQWPPSAEQRALFHKIAAGIYVH